MTKEQEIVRSVFDAYIRDAKAISTKKDRPTFDMLEEVKNMAIKALEQRPSDDCVDINHVIATISQHHFDKDKHNFDLLVHNLCKEVKALPPVTPTQKWISADGWLPKQGVEVLTCNDHGFIEIQSLEDGYWENQHGDWTDLEDNDIVAWMPLPTSYEEKRGDE